MPNYISGARPVRRPSVNVIISLSCLLIICGLSDIPSAQAFDCNNVTEIPYEECQALKAIYNSTGGDNWTNADGWMQDANPCNWNGVTCIDEHVTELHLSDNNLNPHSPWKIGLLTNLTKLDLSDNELTNLPTDISDLTYLNYLYLSYNQLSNLPSEIDNLIKLKYLDLSYNKLESLPTTICNLDKLQVLKLSYNQLRSLPPEIGTLTDLHSLYFDNNEQLCGPLPQDLATISNLADFGFSNTNLCEPLNQEFQDWLSSLVGKGNLFKSGIDCHYMVLTHEPDNTIGDIETFLNDNDLSYRRLYDDTRGNFELKQALGVSRSYLLETAPTNSRDLLQRLRELSEVEDCTYNEKLHPDRYIEFSPIDIDRQPNFSPSLFSRVEEKEYWKTTRPPHAVLTAVVDDFRQLPQIIASPDADIPRGHGEFVAGLADSGKGDMLLLNVALQNREHTSFDRIFKAIEYVVDEKIEGGYETAVINISLSAPITDIGEDAEEQQRIANLFQRWLQYAQRSGVTVVTSMGNFDWNVPHYPAALLETIAIGGTDRSYWRWQNLMIPYDPSGSNFGQHIQLVTLADHPDTGALGTSFAGARVTRVASSLLDILIRQGHDPVAEPYDHRLRWLLRATAIDGIGAPYEDTPGWDPYYGWGVMDEEAAMACAEQEQILIRPPSVDFDEVQVGASATAFVRMTNCFRDTAFMLAHRIQDADDFGIGDAPAEQFLPPGQTRTLEIIFNPQSMGENKNTQLLITPSLFTDDSNNISVQIPENFVIELTGTAKCSGQAGVSVTPTVHNFGAVLCGESETMQFTLTNCNSNELIIQKVRFSEHDVSTEFKVNGLPKGSVIAELTSHTFEISFNPVKPLARHAILEIDIRGLPPIEIGLYGSGRLPQIPDPEPPGPTDPQQAAAQADALMQQANALYKADAFWEALELYQQAYKIYLSAEHRRGQARALNGMGLSYAGAGRLENAIQMLSESRSIWRDLSVSLEEGIVLNQMALLNSRLGNDLAAIKSFEQLLEIEQNLQRPHDVGRTRLNLGAAYFNLNDVNTARTYFEDALTAAQDVNDIEGQAKAWMNMGQIHRLEEQYDQALEAYEQALALTNQLEDSAVLQGTLLLQSGDVYLSRNQYADALNLFKESLDVFQQADYFKGVIAARQKIAELYWLEGNTGEILNHLNEALTYCSSADRNKEAEILGQLLEVYEYLGDAVAQATILNDLAESRMNNNDLEKALELLQQAQGLNQSNGDISETRRTHMLLGEVYLRQRNHNPAIDSFLQALNSAENGVEYGDEARILTDLGQAYFQKGKLAMAWEQLDAALKIQPNNGRAWLYLGELYLLTEKDDDDAQNAFNQALQNLNETDYTNRARAKDGLAEFYRRDGKPWQAIEALKDALLNYRLAGDFENEAQTLTALGEMYAKQGSQSEAMRAFQDALECYRESGDTEAQLDIFQRIIELRDSDDPAIQLELAQAYMNAGEYAKAKNALAEAGQAYEDINDPIGQARVRLQTGIIHRILQDYLSALDEFNQALNLMDENANSLPDTEAAMLRAKILSDLGQTYFRQGLYGEALNHYQRALEEYENAGDLDGQGQTLMKMGEAYLALGDDVKSVQYYNDALEMLKQTDEHIYQVMAYLQNAATDGERGLYWDAVEAYLQALGIIHEAGMFMYAEELHRYKTDILLPPVVTPTPTPPPNPSPSPRPSPTPGPGPTTTNASLTEPVSDVIRTNTNLAITTPGSVPTSDSSSPTSEDTAVAPTKADAHSEGTAPPPDSQAINNTPPGDGSNPGATTRDGSSSTNEGSNKDDVDVNAPSANASNPGYTTPDGSSSTSEGLIKDDVDSNEVAVADPGEESDIEKNEDEPPIDDDDWSEEATNMLPGRPAYSPTGLNPMPSPSRIAPTETPKPHPKWTQASASECQRTSEGLPPTDDPRLLKPRADTLKRCAEHYLHVAEYATSLKMTLPEIDIRKRIDDREGAIQALIRKLGLFQKTGRSKIEQAEVMRAIAGLMILQGRDKEALAYLTDALAIFLKKGLYTQAARTQNSIGLVWLRQGEFLKAERAFLDAQAILKKHPDSAAMALTNGNLGILRYSLGQYGQALEFFQKALDIIDLLESERMFNVLARLGKTAYHFRLGHLARARQNFERTLAEYKKTQYLSIKATLLNHLGLVHYKQMRKTDQEYTAAQELYGKSMAFFKQARTMMQALKEQAGAWTVANNMGLLEYRMGRIAQQSGQSQTVTAYYNWALTAFQEIDAQAFGGKAGQSATLHNLGRVYIALGQYDEALNRFKEALAKALDADRARIEGEMGYVYEHKGNLAKALAYYVRSINISERIRREARIDAFKISLADQAVDVFQRAIVLLVGMGRIEEAFNLSEQARARALLEQLGARPERPPSQTPSKLMAAKLASKTKLRQLRQQLQKERVHANKRQNRPNHAIALLEKQIDAQLIKHDQMDHALKIRQAEARAFTPVKPLTMSQVKQHLNDDDTLVSYFVTPQKIVAFILTRNASHAVEIPVRESELAQVINWTPQASADYPILPALQKLHQWLVKPLQPYLKTRTVRVVPHGILHHVPFHALTADGKSYFGDRCTLARLPSASVLRFLQEKHLKSGERRVLAIGNPSGPAYGLKTLKHVKHETETVAEIFSTKAYFEQEATESRFISEAENARIIFVSSHARLNSARPRYSHLVLMPDATHDGLLEVREINKLNLKNVELVVLSACNTYLGKQSRGDEIVGLTRAFLYAGAPSVVSSLWKVLDEPTGFFMKSFSKSLSSGMGKAEALARARIATRKKYSNPLFWAPFVLTGDPGNIDDLVTARADK